MILENCVANLRLCCELSQQPTDRKFEKKYELRVGACVQTVVFRNCAVVQSELFEFLFNKLSIVQNEPIQSGSVLY